MYAKSGQVVTFLAHYVASGVAATGLTVTAKVWEIRADGSKVPNDTTGTTATVTEIGGGGYLVVYTMTGDGVPFCVFTTAGVADQKSIGTAALSLANLDAAVTSRQPSGAVTLTSGWGAATDIGAGFTSISGWATPANVTTATSGIAADATRVRDILEADVDVDTVAKTITWKHKDTGATLYAKTYDDAGTTQGLT